MMTTPRTSMRSDGTTGSVVVEVDFPTDVDDLWDAVSDPDPLSRWLATVDGDPRPGVTFSLVFTSGWQGTGTVTECDPPRRLVVDTTDGEGDTTTITATLTATQRGSRLRVEESGIPVAGLRAYGAGWHVHAEDLGTFLAGGSPGPWLVRWRELAPAYEAAQVDTAESTAETGRAGASYDRAPDGRPTER